MKLSPCLRGHSGDKFSQIFHHGAASEIEIVTGVYKINKNDHFFWGKSELITQRSPREMVALLMIRLGKS